MSLSANFANQTGDVDDILTLNNITVDNGGFSPPNLPFPGATGTSIALILGYGYSFTLTGFIESNDLPGLEITIMFLESSGGSQSVTLSPPLPPRGPFQYNFDTEEAAESQAPSVLIFAFTHHGSVVAGSFLITVNTSPTPQPPLTLAELIAALIAFLDAASPRQRKQAKRLLCCALQCKKKEKKKNSKC